MPEETMVYGFGDVEEMPTPEIEDDALGELFRDVNALRREQELRRMAVLNETQTSDRNLSVKIPNVYKRWQPLEYIPPPEGESPRRSSALPEGVEENTPLKVIFRGGQHDKGRAGRFFWGDAEHMGVIVGYRVIKLTTRPQGDWISWGLLHDAGVTLDTQNGIPEGLSPTARVQVILRNNDEPQPDTRLARSWNWQVDGPEDGYHNDIMRYRVVE